MPLELRGYQKKTIRSLFSWMEKNQGNPCVVLPTGCHAKGQGILMAKGMVKAVEDIAVGDYVMGGDGTPRKVITLHQGFDDMYQIIPIKGRPFTVNAGHILSLISTNEGKEWDCCATENEIENISVSEYLGKSKNYKHLHKLYRGKVESFGGKAELPIPPYVLGVILGDGSITKNSLSVTTPDTEIYPEIISFAKSIGCIVRIDCNSSGCPTLNFRGEDKFTRGNAVYNRMLEALDIKGCRASEKFIPFIYRTASWNDRLDILAGILDTDGHLTHSNYDYISKSKQLADDVVFIARSVGLAAYVQECEKFCQTGNGGRFYRVCISGDTDIIPCRVKRKKAEPRQQKKRVTVTGFHVEYVGHGKYYGFECDGDHLYMLDDFTVTHNSGKSLVIAGFIEETLQNWPDTRILVLTHQKELIEQDARQLHRLLPDVSIGIYAASLRLKELDQPVTFASIQSIYRKQGIFWNVILVDECHLINNNDEGMYRTFLKSCGRRVIGFTATPYRMGQGYLTDGDGLFRALISEVSVLDLQNMGYLAKLRSKGTFTKLDCSDLHLRGGEFIESELQEKLDVYSTNEAIAEEIVKSAAYYGREHILIFCSGVEHAKHIAEILSEKGMTTEDINGSMDIATREDILYRFTHGLITALTNTQLLTTGFDYPDIDMICMLRPTMSPGLYSQELGRGLRLKNGKNKDCLVLDFAGNVQRHGPLAYVAPPSKKSEGRGGVAPCKECPECLEIVPASAAVCPSCGYEFPKNDMTWILFDGDVNGDGLTAHRCFMWLWTIVPSRKTGIPQIVCEYRTMDGCTSRKFYQVWNEGWAGQKGRQGITELMRKLRLTMVPDEGWQELVNRIAACPHPEIIVTQKDKKLHRYENVVREFWEEDVKRIEEQARKLKEEADEHRKRILGK